MEKITGKFYNRKLSFYSGVASFILLVISGMAFLFYSIREYSKTDPTLVTLMFIIGFAGLIMLLVSIISFFRNIPITFERLSDNLVIHYGQNRWITVPKQCLDVGSVAAIIFFDRGIPKIFLELRIVVGDEDRVFTENINTADITYTHMSAFSHYVQNWHSRETGIIEKVAKMLISKKVPASIAEDAMEKYW